MMIQKFDPIQKRMNTIGKKAVGAVLKVPGAPGPGLLEPVNKKCFLYLYV